jgi:hypothetical protein
MKKGLVLVVICMVFLASCDLTGLMGNPIKGSWSYSQSGATLTMTLKSDQTFVITDKIGTTTTTIQTGTWSATSSQLTLVDSTAGSTIVAYTLTSNNSVLTITPGAGDPMIFKRT